MKFKNLTLLYSTIIVSIFATTAIASNSDSKVNDAINSAIDAQKLAAKVGYEWRDTRKLIKSAKKSATKGDSAKAISLAQKAEQQGIAAVKQYHIEAARYKSNH